MNNAMISNGIIKLANPTYEGHVEGGGGESDAA